MINKIYNRNNRASNTNNQSSQPTATEQPTSSICGKRRSFAFLAHSVVCLPSNERHNKMQFRHQKYTVNGARVASRSWQDKKRTTARRQRKEEVRAKSHRQPREWQARGEEPQPHPHPHKHPQPHPRQNDKQSRARNTQDKGRYT